MEIGIIADTHDNVPKIVKAVKILNSRKVNFVIHCGDFIAPFSLIPFKGLNCDWIGVFGNNDGEKKGLLAKSENRIKEAPYLLELEGIRIVITHEFKDSDADIILFGHSHEPSVKRNSKLIINPGEVGGWLQGKSSLAIVDLKSMEAEIIYF